MAAVVSVPDGIGRRGEVGAPWAPHDPEPGYYPVPGAALGTVRGWDGERWRDPTTTPGFYPAPDGTHVWWNGRSWVAEITLGATAAPVIRWEPGGTRRRPGARLHSRRRPSVWVTPTTTLGTGTATLAAVLAAIRLH